MSSVVNKGLKVDIFPDKSMEHVLNQIWEMQGLY